MTELTALTPDELDMVSGGASASAATASGTQVATAGAADTLFEDGEIEGVSHLSHDLLTRLTDLR